MASRTVRTLYRLFLRAVRQAEPLGGELHVRQPVDREAWLMQGGGHGWALAHGEYELDALRRSLPWLAEVVTSGSFTTQQLRECVRRCFRAPPPAEGGEGEALNRGFDALRLLGEQLHLQRFSSAAQSDGVHVEVTSAFIGLQQDVDPTYEPEEGEPQKQYYTYRVRVSNLGKETVQLLGRHWLIRDAQGKVIVEVPRGSQGVVGCTPIISPNQCFQYYSGTDIEGQTGSMEGSFQMAALDARKLPVREFDARVAPFHLVP